MIVMFDMSTGKRLYEESFGEHEDEILNANWLPLPEAAVQLQPIEPDAARPVRRAPPPLDADEFLRIVYLNQE